MPSYAPPPVLQEYEGWSPYQQQTSAARVIESPIPAMLLGSGAEANALCGARMPTVAKEATARSLRNCIVHPLCRDRGWKAVMPGPAASTPSVPPEDQRQPLRPSLLERPPVETSR